MVHETPQAVAADDRPPQSPPPPGDPGQCPPTASADAAGGRGNPFRNPPSGMSVVPDIEPRRGFRMLVFDVGDGSPHPGWFRHEGFAAQDLQGGIHILGTSRFNFTPTQARWDWMVENDFPSGATHASGIRGPLCDDFIDAAIANRRRVAAA